MRLPTYRAGLSGHLPVNVEVGIESETTYYSLDKRLSKKIQSIAQERDVSADTLINLWVQEKIQEQSA